MPTTLEEEKNAFRDSISTVDESGKRVWIYPKKPKGKYYSIREIVSVVLLALLFATPFLRIGGEPVLLLDILDRKFVLFGQIFWPQDSHLFALGLITIILFVILFTVVYGRLFCGWVCPQTIFMEMVFRKIEYWIEGDWKAQQKLDKMPWNKEKIRKKVSKNLIFYGISFLIANTFLAYLIGSDRLIETVTQPPTANLGTFVAIVVFSLLFYMVFTYLREQVCTTICPYGRLQGVLLDRQSVVVAYDYVRGENRGRYRKKENREELGLGDCIDCNQCVNVCPTGIDIRNGTQLECINCTACMDACDTVMEKINKPKGLIRYDSEEGIATRTPFRLSTRAKAYTGVLFLLVGVVVTLLLTRTEVETTILRTPGMLYQTQEDGRISNLYSLKVINKTNNDLSGLELQLLEGPGELKMVGDAINVERQGSTEQAFFIIRSRESIKSVKSGIVIGVYDNGELIEKVSTNFMGPI